MRTMKADNGEPLNGLYSVNGLKCSRLMTSFRFMIARDRVKSFLSCFFAERHADCRRNIDIGTDNFH